MAGSLGLRTPLVTENQVTAAKEMPGQKRDSGWPTGHMSEQKGAPSYHGGEAGRSETLLPKSARGIKDSEQSPGRYPAADVKGKRTDVQQLQVSRTFLG